MAEPSRASPLSELRSALPSLPMRLREVGRFVAANDYDATTRSMRELASVAGADPASFTRLAKALGYSGWEELRAALTEARALVGEQGGRVHAEANYLVIRTKSKALSEVFNTGRYIDRIVREADALKFTEKLCVFDSELIPNSIIYPL